MIKISFYCDGFKVTGHAYHGEKGKDIVCSAVSGICLGSINWFDQNDVVIFKQNVKKPELILKVKVNDKNKIALSLIETQIVGICESYSHYCHYHKYEKELE